MITVRKAEIGDINEITKLLYQVASVHHKGRPDIFMDGCVKYSADELADIISDEKTPVLVAVEDAEIVGHGFCVIKEAGENGVLVNNKTLYIDDICVDEKHRGRHIGTLICNEILKLAERQGCYNVTLNVWCLNSAAVEFYKALGFKPQKIVMETVLQPNASFSC